MSESELRDDLRDGNGDRENREGQQPSRSPNLWGNSRVIWRLVALATALIFLYVVRDILPPFILAGMLAFILVAGWSRPIERGLRVPRGLAVLLTMSSHSCRSAVVVALTAPMLIRESSALIRRGPALLTEVVVQVLGTRQFELFGQIWTTAELSAAADPRGARLDGGTRAALHVATIALETMIFGTRHSRDDLLPAPRSGALGSLWPEPLPRQRTVRGFAARLGR